MIYSNDRIMISPWTDADMKSERYLSWFHDPEVTRFNSHGLFPMTKQARDSFKESIDRGERIVWGIRERVVTVSAEEKLNALNEKRGAVDLPALKVGEVGLQDDFRYELVGNISLQSINFINRSAELAIVIGEREAWGKGYATEAVRMVLEHAFVVIGLNRVWTGTAALNKGMQKVAIKAGFQEEGVFRQGMWLRGDFVDVIAYGITAGEYDGLINRETIDEINALENLS